MEDEIIYPGLEEQKKFERQKAPSDLLSNIAELSKNASTLHLLYVGVLIYWALTILGISDRQLVFNEQARLPIVGINVPLSGFTIIVPLLATVFFIYFYLHFQALTRAIIYLKNNYAPTEEEQLIIWVLSTDIASEIGLMRVIKG